MAKRLIPEDLDTLIQEYLTDGVLTEKERQVILKKAVELKLDRDEIDLYLDAQLQKIDQANDSVVRRKKSKECPYCGAPVPQLADKCPECGQFITPEASKDLEEIIEKLEDALVSFKTGSDIKKNKALVDRYVRKARLYYSNNPKIQKLLEEIDQDTIKTEKSAKTQVRLDNIISFLSSNKKFLWQIVSTLIFFIGCSWVMGNDRESKEEKERNIDTLSEQTVKLIEKDSLNEAKTLLLNDKNEISYGTYKNYDVMYLRLIRAYVTNSDYDTAEELGLVMRSKVSSSYMWDESTTRQYLIKTFKDIGRDYSIFVTKEEMKNGSNSINVDSVKLSNEIDSIVQKVNEKVKEINP